MGNIIGSNNAFPSVLLDEQGSAPTTPASGFWRVYAKSDGLYIVDDAGTETGPLSTGGGASPNLNVYNRNSTNYTTTSTSFTDVDATNMALALTHAGATRARVMLVGVLNSSTRANTSLDLLIDGTSVSGGEGILIVRPDSADSDNLNASFTWITEAQTAASHTYKLQWKTASGTATLFAGEAGGTILQFAVEEIA